MRARNLSHRGGPRNAIPLCAEGLRLVVEPIADGRLAPAVTLRVHGPFGATSIGATVPASNAEELAAAIVEAGRRAAETFAMSPVVGPGAA